MKNTSEYMKVHIFELLLFSVASSNMRRNLNRVCDYFEGTIPSYFPDEFKGHFRMARGYETKL